MTAAKRYHFRHGCEWSIVHALRHGMSNARIAIRRGISRDAVKYHVKNAIAKLGLRSRADVQGWRGVPKGSAAYRNVSNEEPAMTTTQELRPRTHRPDLAHRPRHRRGVRLVRQDAGSQAPLHVRQARVLRLRRHSALLERRGQRAAAGVDSVFTRRRHRRRARRAQRTRRRVQRRAAHDPPPSPTARKNGWRSSTTRKGGCWH